MAEMAERSLPTSQDPVLNLAINILINDIYLLLTVGIEERKINKRSPGMTNFLKKLHSQYK